MKKTEKSAILLIYTGGTIGMKESGHGLVPFDFIPIVPPVYIRSMADFSVFFIRRRV